MLVNTHVLLIFSILIITTVLRLYQFAMEHGFKNEADSCESFGLIDFAVSDLYNEHINLRT